MAAAGTASVNSLPVQNSAGDFLCLFIEPYGDVFWLKPDDEVTAVPADGALDPRFSAVTVKHRLIVWTFEGSDPAKVISDCTIVDSNRTELPEGHQGPLARACTDAHPAEPGAGHMNTVAEKTVALVQVT